MVALGYETHCKNHRRGDIRGARACAADYQQREVCHQPAGAVQLWLRQVRHCRVHPHRARGDLIAAGAKIRDYFNNDEEDLIIRTYVGGVLVESLYNEREIHHMRDVKALVRGVYLVQMLALLYIAVYIAVGFWLHGAATSGRRWGAM